jgi:diketogulonate reductase-like aldo/keto reductase
MAQTVKSTITLNNGVKIPQLGFGTALISKDQGKTVDVILKAIECGYRHLDTAMIYFNEEAVGKAVKQSRVPRNEFFITTKMWNEDMRKDRFADAFNESLDRLEMDYVDMYMLHWPVPMKYVKSWKAMEKIYETRKVRVIGVSNFNIQHLEDLGTISDIIPAVNQCEFHPRFSQTGLRKYCREHGIACEAYKPLGQGFYAGNEKLEHIAKKYKKTFAQILIRWHLQSGTIAIPKATHDEYIKSNIDVFDFELECQDMLDIDKMDVGRSTNDCTPSCFDF